MPVGRMNAASLMSAGLRFCVAFAKFCFHSGDWSCHLVVVSALTPHPAGARAHGEADRVGLQQSGDVRQYIVGKIQNGVRPDFSAHWMTRGSQQCLLFAQNLDQYEASVNSAIATSNLWG